MRQIETSLIWFPYRLHLQKPSVTGDEKLSVECLRRNGHLRLAPTPRLPVVWMKHQSARRARALAKTGVANWQRVRASDSSRVSVSTPAQKFSCVAQGHARQGCEGERRDEKPGSAWHVLGPKFPLPHTRVSHTTHLPGSGVTQAHVQPGLSSSRWQPNSLRIPATIVIYELAFS